MGRRYRITKHRNRDSWIKQRSALIGGSDIAKIAGKSRFGDALTVYNSKLQDMQAMQEKTDYGPLYWGNALERPIMKAFSAITEMPVSANRLNIYSLRSMPYVACTPDGIITSNARRPMGLEIKTSRLAGFWPTGSDGVVDVGTGSDVDGLPNDVICQVQWSLGITGFDCWYVAALLSGSDFRVFRVSPSKEDIEFLQDRARVFWEDHILKGIPPEPTENGKPADLTTLYPKSDDSLEVVGAGSMARWCKLYFEAHEQTKLSESAKQYASMMIKSEMKTASFARIAHEGHAWIAKWQNRPGARRFDVTSLKKEEPALHKKYLNRGNETRVFILKKEKGE